MTIANDENSLINASLPKLSKDQQKAALKIIATNFTALTETVHQETVFAVNKLKENLVDMLNGRADKQDPAFESYRQPDYSQIDKLDSATRKATLSAIKQVQAHHKELIAKEKEFTELQNAWDLELEGMKQTRLELISLVEKCATRHNDNVNQEIRELKEKSQRTIAQINREKAAAEIACLFNGDAKVIGAFLASLPRGSLVEQAATRAGLVLPNLKDKVERKLELVG
jgi:hypothetical protein